MNTYIVYGITDCPACLRACADLMEAELEYVFVETDFAKSYREHLKDKYEWPTFPIIVRQLNNITIYEEPWRSELIVTMWRITNQGSLSDGLKIIIPTPLHPRGL